MDRDYCVWPIEVPPVCAKRWDEQSWRKWENCFRPKGYYGGRYDKHAWVKFKKHNLERVQKELLGK